MTISDNCPSCNRPFDLHKRIYRGRDNQVICAICHVLEEARLEIVKITALADMLDEVEGKGALH